MSPVNRSCRVRPPVLRDISAMHDPRMCAARTKRKDRMVLRLVGFVIEAGIFFLQVAGVGKNDSAQINSRRRGVNRSAESFFYEARNPAAVVEVSVRQDDRINFLGRNRRAAPVALAPFFRALKEAAIDENLDAVFLRRVSRIDQMLRAGDRFRGAQKLDVGQAFPPGLTINPPARTVSPW